jgi:hypothetical protein
VYSASGILHKNLSKNDWLIIASNLIPVLGVWFFEWSATEVFIVYALETLITGILTVLKLLISTLARKQDAWYNNGASSRVSGFFFIIFFILHFGVFAAVQTGLFSSVAKINPPGSGPMHFFFHWWEYITGDIAWMLGGFLISYLARDFLPFVIKKEYTTLPMMILMFQPYGRIFIQQVTVILGSMFLSFGAGKIFVLVFASVKIFFEMFINYEGILNLALKGLKKTSGNQ